MQLKFMQLKFMQLSQYILLSFLPQNQLFGKGKDTIFDAGARIKGAGVRIKRALSPGRNMDGPSFYDSPTCSPASSPKVPRLSFDPEISDDDDDDKDDNGDDGDGDGDDDGESVSLSV